MNDLNDIDTQTSARKPRKAAPKPAKEELPPDTLTEVEVTDEVPVLKSPVPEKKVAKPSGGKKFVFFSSGAGYVTKSGFKFSPENRIYELDSEEADHLLSLSNFRLPDQLELEEYYKENN